MAATILDPHFKAMYFNSMEKQSVKDSILRFLSHRREEAHSETIAEDSTEPQSSTLRSAGVSSESSLWDELCTRRILISIERSSNA